MFIFALVGISNHFDQRKQSSQESLQKEIIQNLGGNVQREGEKALQKEVKLSVNGYVTFKRKCHHKKMGISLGN